MSAGASREPGKEFGQSQALGEVDRERATAVFPNPPQAGFLIDTPGVELLRLGSGRLFSSDFHVERVPRG